MQARQTEKEGARANGCAEEGMVLGAAQSLAGAVYVAGGGGGAARGEDPVPRYPHISEVCRIPVLHS